MRRVLGYARSQRILSIMADTGPETISSAAPGDSSRTRRAHTYSRLTTAIAVLALATAGYALVRLDSMRDKLDTANALSLARRRGSGAAARRIEEPGQPRAQAAPRSESSPGHAQRRAEAVAGTGSLRRRTARPRRRPRARMVAGRSFVSFRTGAAPADLDRDVETAIVALESADLRLASLRDQAFRTGATGNRQELQALRAVPLPDTTGVCPA